MTTLDFYNKNAQNYLHDTAEVDMTPLYQQFLPHLKPGAHILDAGCGSGRDSLHFIQQGYQVTLLDPCEELAKAAEQRTGQPVHRTTFQQIQWQNMFDAIWACASLLHVPKDQLPDVFQRLKNALKPEGILYVSFKYGDTEREKDGRHFTDLDEEELSRLLENIPEFEIVKTWVTLDWRPSRQERRWLNLIAKAA